MPGSARRPAKKMRLAIPERPNRIRTVELVRILSDASIFAGRGWDIPVLRSVQLEATGLDLIAMATDRFTLGCSRTAFTVNEFKINLDLDDVRTLIGMGRVRSAEWVTISRNHGVLTFRFDDGHVYGTEVKVRHTGREFPEVRKFFDQKAEDTIVPFGELVRFNPKYLSRFGRVKGDGQVELRILSADRIVLVRVGSDFVGAIMPVRLPDGTKWIKPSWV